MVFAVSLSVSWPWLFASLALSALWLAYLYRGGGGPGGGGPGGDDDGDTCERCGGLV